MVAEIQPRIVFINPPRGVSFGFQRGKTDIVPPTQTTDKAVSFDLSVRVENIRPDGAREPAPGRLFALRPPRGAGGPGAGDWAAAS